MRRSVFAVLTAGFLLSAVLSGCGTAGTIRQGQGTDDGSGREEELQAEIDALQKEIDELKEGQETQDTGSSDTDGQSAEGGNGSGHSSRAAVTLEEAQEIALDRVQGATARNISIELDEDDGWYVYEGEIVYDGMEYEFEIDADTGNILKWEEERW